MDEAAVAKRASLLRHRTKYAFEISVTSGVSTVVERLTTDPEIEGSNPAEARQSATGENLPPLNAHAHAHALAPSPLQFQVEKLVSFNKSVYKRLTV